MKIQKKLMNKKEIYLVVYAKVCIFVQPYIRIGTLFENKCTLTFNNYEKITSFCI